MEKYMNNWIAGIEPVNGEWAQEQATETRKEQEKLSRRQEKSMGI